MIYIIDIKQLRLAKSGSWATTPLPRIERYFDRRAICSPRQHAILIGAQLCHGVGKPDAAINDEAQHHEGEQVVHHAMPIIIVLAAVLVFA